MSESEDGGARPDAAPALTEIQARLDKRRAPHLGTCASCGHQQAIANGYQPMPGGLAAEQWRCAACGGQITVTVMCGSDEPSPDEDIATLFEQLAVAQAEREELEGECHDHVEMVQFQRTRIGELEHAVEKAAALAARVQALTQRFDQTQGVTLPVLHDEVFRAAWVREEMHALAVTIKGG